MDDDKAVGMTTDAKPLPLSAEELANIAKWNKGFENSVNSHANGRDVARFLATIAALKEQVTTLTSERDTYKQTCDSDFDQFVALWAERDSLRKEIEAAKAIRASKP